MTWSDIKDFLAFSGFVALVTGLLVAAIVGVHTTVAWYKCGYYARQTELRTEFNTVAGCYVESGGKMIPYSEFKARAITNEDVAK